MSAALDIEAVLENEAAQSVGMRERKRPQPIKLDRDQNRAVVQRCVQFFEDDDQARSMDKAMRLQRYAKLMQYQSEVREPYPGASNVQLSDIMSAVLRTEDTLQNAAMSARPMVNTKAMNPANRDRERKADLLLDHQFFVEQDGEGFLEHASMNFVRDGFFVALSRWVREHRNVLYTRNFGPIPAAGAPERYFRTLIEGAFSPGAWATVAGTEGWDWNVTQGKTEYLVRFYTEDDGDVTMQVEGLVETHAGPINLVYDYEDVLAPAWSLNLQPPGPSNPAGAPHVVLVDYPTKDEILRGVEQGFYDLVTEEDLKGVEGWTDWESADRELDRQRRAVRGQDETAATVDAPEEHQQLKRLIVFDLWGGLDVVWTVLVGGPNYLLRARPLTEFSPGIPPRRPLAHACMIPVQGTWVGMGLPELMESMHDFMCTSFNMMVDAGVFEMFPWFKYRPGALKAQDVHIMPGGGIPMNDPTRDMVAERLNPQATQVGVNLVALGQSEQEKLISIGDLQLGRIPAGKSSALRTSGGIQQVLAQGEARPERILRRFFKGITQVYRTMYQLDRHFLDDEKEFRVIGISRPEEDPFMKVTRADDLVDFLFDFHANVLNSSKVALQQGLNEVLALTANPLMLQMGISTPETIYRILADLVRALGQNAEAYLQEPSPDASSPPILAQEALSQIMAGRMPQGPPAEGDFTAHQQALEAILQEVDERGESRLAILTLEEQQRLGLYIQGLQQRALEAQRQAQLLAAAQTFAAEQQQRSDNPSKPQGQPSKPAMVERNDTADESLPSSGTPQ